MLCVSVSPDDEQGFQLRLFCECSKNEQIVGFNFEISGFQNGRGDGGTMEHMTQQPPYILTMSIPQNVSGHHVTRKRRSLTPDTCTA